MTSQKTELNLWEETMHHPDEISPVIFLNFNRPEKTEASLKTLRAAAPRSLLMFADGPRGEHPEDEKRCAEVRKILSTGIDWPCNAWTYFPDKNLGCGHGVASAISTGFGLFEEAIILEDDCLPSQEFYTLTSKLLQTYRHDTEIGAINGNNFQDGIDRGRATHYRSRIFHCWGWATWRRVWQKYDFYMRDWPAYEKSSHWRDLALSDYERKYWHEIFEAMYQRKMDSVWDYQFFYALLSKSLVCLTPNKNLVSNTGFGPDATHTKHASDLSFKKTESLDGYTASLPRYPDVIADEYTFWRVFHNTDSGLKSAILKILKSIADAPLEPSDDAILKGCAQLKALVRLPGVDMLRGQAFLKQGKIIDAVQSMREELRWFPNNTACAALLQTIEPPTAPSKFSDPIFAELYALVSPHTMLTPERLFSLYTNARDLCDKDYPGDFAECGVAAGGSTLLLALVIQRYSKRPRRLYAFDTFEGMPAPSENDNLNDQTNADDTYWGSGTCSSPLSYVENILTQNGVMHLVHLRKGLFKETLPGLNSESPVISLLHMDGDWYESTLDILNNLYDRVIPGGIIQIDDYGHWPGCRRACDEFFTLRNIYPKLNVIDYTARIFKIPNNESESKHRLPYANLGCGSTFSDLWQNFDFNSDSPFVKACDINHGIPLQDASMRVVYSSHFIEHLTRRDAHSFIRECFRVLEPGGLLRIVFPDLEALAREYLQQFENCLAGKEGASEKHAWMTVELIDQLVRHESGGEMLRFIAQQPKTSLPYISQRVGEWVNFVSEDAAKRIPLTHETQVGRFRLSGEVHQWMYDRISISRLLQEAGFVDVTSMTATESNIPDFQSYKLDSLDGIKPRKPDSRYVEARKPTYQSTTSSLLLPGAHTPSSFCTIATRGVLRDVQALLASLSKWMPGSRVYIFSDSYTATKAFDIPFQISLDIKWNICLDPYSEFNRQQMEAAGIWSDFQLMKPKSMLYALNNGERDVMFLDADIFLLRDIKLDGYSGQKSSLSKHHILPKMEQMYGVFNGGVLWSKSEDVVHYWMERFPFSRYYDQACLEDVFSRYECHVMHEAQNISPYRIYRAKENPALLLDAFTIESGRLQFKDKPVQFVHTHLYETQGIFGAFNQLLLDLTSREAFDDNHRLLQHFALDRNRT